MLWMFQRANNMPSDRLNNPNTQNRFRCHKVKTSGAKGRLGENLQQYFLYWLHSISFAGLTSSTSSWIIPFVGKLWNFICKINRLKSQQRIVWHREFCNIPKEPTSQGSSNHAISRVLWTIVKGEADNFPDWKAHIERSEFSLWHWF
jgi:hypothetical protein